MGGDQQTVQELMDFFIEELHDDLCIMDGEGTVLRVSGTWLKKHDVEAGEVVGINAAVLEKRGVFRPSVTLAVLREKKRVEMIQYNKYGEKILVSGVPIFNEQGEIAWVVSYSAWDISNFNELKEKYSETKQQMERYSAELKELRARSLRTPKPVAESEQMKHLLGVAELVAKEDINLLITGETGVGKSMIAKLVHQMSRRADGPFIEINCGAIPENLLESELFGYEKGAFTGASREGKIGLIELSNHGTLFLDEVGEMSHGLQVKLLHTLQERRITRVGGVKSVGVDFRLITATNRDLKAMIKENKFRADLFFRISVVPLTIPPLRERPADLQALIDMLFYRLNRKYGKKKRLSLEARRLLLAYSWPGNVRELENVLEQLIVTSVEDNITTAHIPSELLLNSEAFGREDMGLKEALEHYEGKLVMHAYQKYHTTVDVGRALRISQPTAARKISKYRGLFKNE
ncbi:RNA polymerase subunit sigma-54 [Oscillospiraceae bacterium]|nr:RNA polymerase subunit sigma-54 [Oscillospiraceae bacterium]BDF75922.1 RNA polymerase subunit sigma-54 [Oscillospiraceae bacterium]